MHLGRRGGHLRGIRARAAWLGPVELRAADTRVGRGPRCIIFLPRGEHHIKSVDPTLSKSATIRVCTHGGLRSRTAKGIRLEDRAERRHLWGHVGLIGTIVRLVTVHAAIETHPEHTAGRRWCIGLHLCLIVGCLPPPPPVVWQN